MNGLGAGSAATIYERAFRSGGLTAAGREVAVHCGSVVAGEFWPTDWFAIVSWVNRRQLARPTVRIYIDYPTATGLPVFVLLNFGKARVEVQRVVRDL